MVIKTKLPDHKHGNLYLGYAYYYYSRIGFYLGVPGLLLSLATFWQTGGWKYFNIPFPVVVLFVVLSSLVLVWFDHVYATPAIAAVANRINKEQNPILTELAEVRKENAELKEMIQIIIDLK